MRLELRPTTSADLYAVSRLEQPTEVSRHLATTGIAWHREVLADPANHHLLVLHDAGAYGASMSSNYNSRPLAAEVLVDGTRHRLIRHRQTVAELLALENV